MELPMYTVGQTSQGTKKIKETSARSASVSAWRQTKKKLKRAGLQIVLGTEKNNSMG
jgi:hypothetical protein